MNNPLGLKRSLAVSFIGLALVLLWLNHMTASDLRGFVVKQREVDKARAVALIVQPIIRHESEWVETVSHLLQHDLSAAMELEGNRGEQALTELLDRTYRQARIDVLEITDTQGVVRYRAQAPEKRGDVASFWGVEEALEGRETLVSLREQTGPLLLFVAPVRAGEKIIGTVSAGKRIDHDFVKTLSREIGANIALATSGGVVSASSKQWDKAPDASAISEAFQHKEAAFRSVDESHITQAYLPVMIVDDAWLLIAEIDSSSAFSVIDNSNRKAMLFTLGSIVGAILLTLVILRINLIPLRHLRRRVERMISVETGAPPADAKAKEKANGDDFESIVGSLNDLTDILISHHRSLAKQRADLKISTVAFESQQAMVITNAKFVVLSANKAFTDLTGHKRGSVVGHLLELQGGDNDQELLEAIRHAENWQGEVLNRRKSGETYPLWLNAAAVKNDLGEITHFVMSYIDLTENRKAAQQIRELAFFDPVTRLPNRRLLMDRLKQTVAASARNGNFGAILLIDIDDFKTINNALGHESGDRLLQQVALRLTRCIREAETVARLGGDEFVAVLGGLSKNQQDAATQVETTGERILAALAPSFPLGQNDYRCTASIGAVLFFGKAVTDDDLLQQANLAMYKAKDNGRNCLQFFNPEMQTCIMERVALEADLRHAIEHEQLVLHYQPQVMADGRIAGAEVLARWNHPERGTISPAAFIPLAERSGLILPLGQWVLETVCVQLAEWAHQPALSHLSIAVNVSARQFHHPDFVGQVFSILQKTGANPERLKLELTESLLVENIQELIAKMLTLKDRGIAFSLDDFGTGYSSLYYLKRLPLEQLKIDQSFVRDILIDANDAAIATTIVALADSLGLEVIAEGVETEAQKNILERSGCHAYQGYLFSKPLPLDDFKQFVQRR